MSHAGAALLVELADRVGLTAALSEAMAPTRERRSAHDPGACCATWRSCSPTAAIASQTWRRTAARRGCSEPGASETTAHRVIKSIDEQLLDADPRGERAARARAWDAGARPEAITLDIDATLMTAHSEKQLAAGNYKGGYGFHPLCCYLDETGEALAAILRPGQRRLQHRRRSLRCARPGARAAAGRGPSARDPGAGRHRRARRTRSPPIAARPVSASRSATSSTTRVRQAILDLPEIGVGAGDRRRRQGARGRLGRRADRPRSTCPRWPQGRG